MSKKLDIYLNDIFIGELEQNKHGQMIFTYSQSWLNNPSAFAISCSLPLQDKAFSQKQCRPFFAGLLPEDLTRKLIARNLGISAANDFSMLEKIGGECAGAISCIKKSDALSSSTNEYKELNISELAAILQKLENTPLLAGDDNIRLSMAGVQDKLPIRYHQGKFFLPLNNSPSTHIIKPFNARFDGLLENENFCMALARNIGLSAAETEIMQADTIKFLLIKRYDRVVKENQIIRLHQEDFCQASGIVPENKYQNEGGPSHENCFNLLRRFSSIPALDLQKLLQTIIFNTIIGNCDAHGKNISLLYQNGITFSPLYDLVCTLYYENLTSKMAMKIGKEYNIKKIDLLQFELLAKKLSITKAGMHQEIKKLIESILNSPRLTDVENDIESNIVKIIKHRCDLLS